MSANKALTVDEQVDQAINDYCDRHGLDSDAVLVDYERDGSGEVVRFRLSRDIDGRSRGCDEWFEVADAEETTMNATRDEPDQGWNRCYAGFYVRLIKGRRFTIERVEAKDSDSGKAHWICRCDEIAFDAADTLAEAKTYCRVEG